MSFSEPLEGLIGLLIVGAILLDVFLTIVVPRRAPRAGRHVRPSRYLIPSLWARWRWVGWRIEQAERREAFLGNFGALAVILLLITWITSLILGYGLLLHALRDQVKPVPESLGAALYLAGTSLLTIGFGDYVPIGGPARLLSLVPGQPDWASMR